MGNIDYSNAQLPEAAMTFASTFLRFEYALKESGYVAFNGDAMVDWGSVSKKLGPTFFEHIKTSRSASTLLTKPPKKQIVENGQLGWKDQEPLSNTHQLFEAVRRVRNNLLHGGKSGPNSYEGNDPGRNETLIAEAQRVIEAAICRLPDVRTYFEGKY